MATKRKSKVITKKEDIDYLINIKEEDITTSFIMETFGEFDGIARFNPYDIITIPPKSYGKGNKKNKTAFTTTVGLWVFNKYFIENDLFDIFDNGYINETMTDGLYSSINKKLSYALAEDDINIEQLKTFQMKIQKCMPYVSILSPNFSDKMLTCTKVITKKKNELLKKYEKEIAAGDEQVIIKIEKELLDYGKEYLKDDPAMDIYLSGARGSIGNNFKNLFVMKGIVKNSDPNAEQKYRLATSNLMDGVSADEYSIFADALVEGPYRRAKKTEVGGEYEKLFLYALQHITLDKPGSDCGTNKYITVYLKSRKDAEDWIYCYMVEGNNLVELTSKNMDKYIGKKVKFRFSSLCKSKTGICNKCMGNLEYRRGSMNPGVESSIIASVMKNKSMKSFHNSVQKFTTIDLNKAFMN